MERTLSEQNLDKKLLTDDEPAAYQLENPMGKAPVFITCDHASNRVPKSLNNLGLNQVDLEKHIAYDIGALAISKYLSKQFDAPLLHSSYSRLVIDLNRQLHDPTGMPEVSDGIVIPANISLTVSQKQARIDDLFWPYHQRFAHVLDTFITRAQIPLIIGVHTFTPHWQGQKRPWDIGVMWDTDDRIANPFLHYLNGLDSICVGDNRPYHAVDPQGVDPVGYAFEVHARSRGLPHLFLEVRQDLVATEEGAKKWADIIYNGLKDVISNQSLMYVING